MKIQYLGQNCFLFSHNGKNILSDPFYNFGKAESGFDLEAQQMLPEFHICRGEHDPEPVWIQRDQCIDTGVCSLRPAGDRFLSFVAG